MVVKILYSLSIFVLLTVSSHLTHNPVLGRYLIVSLTDCHLASWHGII